jgi:hypothetical protein
MPVAQSIAHRSMSAHADGCRDHEHHPVLTRAVAFDATIVRRLILGLMSLALVLPLIPGYPGITCPLRSLTGIPCPFCGTTAAVGEAAHLNLVESLKTNPAPLLAVALAIVLFVIRPLRVRAPFVLVLAIPVGLWAWQLVRFS